MAQLYNQLSGRNYIKGLFHLDWLEGTSKMHSHPFEVLNRVFFSNGMRIKANDGWVQVGEGDFGYVKTNVLHAREEDPANIAQKKRINAVVFKL